MKNICKKLLTIVTCLSLTMCLSVPAFASEVSASAANDSIESMATYSNHVECCSVLYLKDSMK